MKPEDLKFFENLVGGKEKLKEGFGYDYNIFAIEEGIKIAEALQTKEEIVKFHKLNTDEQIKLVPTLNMNEHSGNTFGMACRFAIVYLPQLKVHKRDETIQEIIK